MSLSINFEGKHVLIVGGGRGLGKEMALLFAQCGANVYIGNRNVAQGQEVVEEIKSLGQKAGFTQCDVSDRNQVQNLVNQAAEFAGGKLDVIVNNAGIICTQDFLHASPEEIDNLFKINIEGTSHVIQAALEHMQPHKDGNIITISSIAGRGANTGLMPHYCASKSAVVSLTQSAAHIAAPYHIRVNSVAPGIIRTAMWEEILDGAASGWNGRDGAQVQSEEQREETWNTFVKASIPLGEAQTEEDIANAVVFLASDLASKITGQTLAVDGGSTMV